MPTSFSRLLLAAFTLAAVLGAPLAGAGAQSIERLGDFSDWSAFKYEEGGKAVCFIASEPTKAEGNYTTRGKIHAMVTHRPGEQRTDEVSIQAGYPYKESAVVRSEEHTSELQSLMRISYAVFCLKKKKQQTNN